MVPQRPPVVWGFFCFLISKRCFDGKSVNSPLLILTCRTQHAVVAPEQTTSGALRASRPCCHGPGRRPPAPWLSCKASCTSPPCPPAAAEPPARRQPRRRWRGLCAATKARVNRAKLAEVCKVGNVHTQGDARHASAPSDLLPRVFLSFNRLIFGLYRRKRFSLCTQHCTVRFAAFRAGIQQIPTLDKTLFSPLLRRFGIPSTSCRESL